MFGKSYDSVNVIQNVRKKYGGKLESSLVQLKDYVSKEDGMGVVEVILIVVVLVGLVFIFKDKMTTIVNGMFSSITQGITNVTG